MIRDICTSDHEDIWEHRSNRSMRPTIVLIFHGRPHFALHDYTGITPTSFAEKR